MEKLCEQNFYLNSKLSHWKWIEIEGFWFGLYSSLFVIIFSLVFQQKFWWGGIQKRKKPVLFAEESQQFSVWNILSIFALKV